MSVQQHMAAAMSSLALTGALVVASAGTTIPAHADVVTVTPHRSIPGNDDGSGGAAAVGPWGAIAGGGAGGAAGKIIYIPNQPYNPRFLP